MLHASIKTNNNFTLYTMKRLLITIIGVLLLFVSPSYALDLSDQDLYWLTQNIYQESRDQPVGGQIAVALVTLNRLTSNKWPDTIKEVVTQKGQFSWYKKGKKYIPKERDAWLQAKKVAEVVCNLYDHIDPTHKYIYWFHRYDIFPSWRNEYVKFVKIGEHIFYSVE